MKLIEVSGVKFELSGPNGESIPNQIEGSFLYGTKMLLIVKNTPKPSAFIFDFGPHLGANGHEPMVSRDEFYALQEEVLELQKSKAREALGIADPLKRGPGRPRKDESVGAGV